MILSEIKPPIKLNNCPFCKHPVVMQEKSERPEETLGYDTQIRIACINKECDIQPKSPWNDIYDYSWDDDDRGHHKIPQVKEKLCKRWNKQEG